MATPFGRGSERPCLVTVQDGEAYRIVARPRSERIVPELAEELRRVLERFAAESGFTRRSPVSVFFKPGTFGHHQVGRAVDIYGIGGKAMDAWKAEWDTAMQAASASNDRRTAHILVNRQRMSNLGWRLYKALQIFGRWAQPYGYPVQLFGPWTRTEGPWRHISDKLLYAHRDHIHIGK